MLKTKISLLNHQKYNSFVFQSTFMNNQQSLEDLKEIRKIMEESTKFLSLSGLSGIFAGATALVGAYLAHLQIKIFYNQAYTEQELANHTIAPVKQLSLNLFILAIIILVAAISFGIFFTWLKAKKQGKKLISPLAIKLLISLGVPLFFGGLFVLAIFYKGYGILVAPATLLIYGLSLLNASKYVHVDIKYLALCQMALGVAAVFFPFNGLLFWAIGFGILHILYGTIMYFKYDKK
jgi:hypothetical protein